MTRVGPRVSRSMMARLVGSESAFQMASVLVCIRFNLRVECDRSKTLVKPRRRATKARLVDPNSLGVNPAYNGSRRARN